MRTTTTKNYKKVSFQVLCYSLLSLQQNNIFIFNWFLHPGLTVLTLDLTLLDKQPVNADLKAETSKIILEM